MDDFDATFATTTPCLALRIVRTEEQMSLMMQRFTAYVIEINDFGKVTEVSHRYSDFETLHKALLVENPGLQLPPLPPKGADGTDAAVIAARKVELEKLLRGMLQNVEVLMERSLHLWKFLELGNPSVIAGRFVMAPRARPNVFKTLAKLNDEKYRDDVFRLGHAAVTDLLLEGLREMRKGTESSHWSASPGGRLPLCQLVAGALGTTQAARDRLIDGGVINLLLGLIQNEEAALDDVRPALNVIVAREGERWASFIARFLTTGGLLQLLDLVQRQRCQEFVAKLLWFGWDAGARGAFAQPGGVGLKVLQTLLRSSTTSCSLLAAVLLGAMVAAGDFQDAHRQEALKLVKGTLERPEAAKDPQFAKVLMGGTSSLVRLAAMLEDVDLAPLVLGLLCTSKPAANKLTSISGNLAALISNKGVPHSEQTRALAAELLLHIQGTASAPEVSSHDGAATSAARRSSLGDLLERCEGIAAHEESMEAALRTQLEEGIARGLQGLEPHGVHVRKAKSMAQQRLQDLPLVDFQSFESAFSRFHGAREALANHVKSCERLHENIERQLRDLQTARPKVEPHIYKEKLLAAEQLYAEVKAQREQFATADAEAKEKTKKAEASTAKMKTVNDELRRYDHELHDLRTERRDKEAKAASLRSKANIPGLEDRKRQVQSDIDRNLTEAHELQVVGRRVQQGEDGYLNEGQSREQKISELSSKLNELKRHHQTLLQKQKELDIDPVSLGSEASKLESEAAQLDASIGDLEHKQREAERARLDASSDATREAEDARVARDHSSHLASRLSSVERDAKAQLSTLQPMIQEQHAGWQRLMEQQRSLDDDQRTLQTKLLETEQSAETEARAREQVAIIIQDLVKSLLNCASSLQACAEEPGAPAAAVAASDDFDDFLQEVPQPAASAAGPATGPETTRAEPDIFADEEVFKGPEEGSAPPADPFGADFDGV
ncbi:Laminin subunit alpha-2 (Laminin M chain) (Laminin-12 subunit alpha) (Laminin-2 subunit alpha) (Laminin-4 subunit alpha) (Merosin heavy chain) [Durusdinium trenchii]|uniref:Laminin subunit alpha-2 (Laminin M chain) (Laminin-12 subunit alpha) (Laminin-2 subunit alpha) (Laminin-4 subunit alpha) (Merosin heavy chain) n=1 Tax=Durusdinium trenchii TaxID=1381693 RepID=A0ABP0SLQ5_9DINO